MAPTDQSSSFNFNFNVVNEYEHKRDCYNRYGYNRYGNHSYGNNSYGNHRYGNNRYGNNRYQSTSSTASSSSGNPQFGRSPQQHRPSLLATPGPSRAAVGTLSHGSRSHESPLMLNWLESQQKDGFLCYYHRKHGDQAVNCESSLCMKYARYVKKMQNKEARDWEAYSLGERDFQVIPRRCFRFNEETQENPADFVNGSQVPMAGNEPQWNMYSCGHCPCFDITSAYPYMAQTPVAVRPSLLMNTWGYLMASPTSQPTTSVVQPYVPAYFPVQRNQIYQANCRGG